jgi:hypothetical protein
MGARMFVIANIMINLFLSVSCVSMLTAETNTAKAPPAIIANMDLEDALQAAIQFGGSTSKDVRKLIVRRKQWPLAEKILYQAIQDGIFNYQNAQLINAVMLYTSGPVQPQEALFSQMVTSGRPLARQLAWQMAAALPGKPMRQAMERELNRAVYEDDEQSLFFPAMAVAVQENRMTTAYSVVRRGLFLTNQEEFAQAMATLNPEQASADLLDYLAICPPEELRQLTQSSINIFAATVALNHMLKFPPSIAHSRLETVFYYAISRNPGLSDLALSLVDVLVDKNQSAMALTLSRMPVWTQVAFIEGARRNLTASKRVFLSELKKVTAQNEIIEELGDVKL